MTRHIDSLLSVIFLLIGLKCTIAVQLVQAEPWHFNIRNDYVIPGGLDRYLTNAFEIKSGRISFVNEMYSPTSKKNPEIPYGDRQWDGLSYFQYEDIDRVNFGEEIIKRWRVGAVGEWSGSEALQKFIHDDLGAGQHPTWAGQNPSEPTLSLVYSKRTREYLKSVVGDSQVRQEYGLEIGNVKDLIFLDQELRKHFFKYFYPYVGLRGEAVLYNTLLDGRLFQDNYYTTDKKWFVATARAGFEIYFPESEWFLDYHYEYLTEEFDGQEGRHSYGSLTFGKKF